MLIVGESLVRPAALPIIEAISDIVDRSGFAGARVRYSREADVPLIVSTAHKAKGREFATVVVPDDFDLPSELVKRRRKDASQLHETNQLINLLYVACTRATDRLYLAEGLFNELC